MLKNDGRDFAILSDSNNRAYYFDHEGTATGETQTLNLDDQGDILDAIEVELPLVEILVFENLPAERVVKVEFISEVPI